MLEAADGILIRQRGPASRRFPSACRACDMRLRKQLLNDAADVEIDCRRRDVFGLQLSNSCEAFLFPCSSYHPLNVLACSNASTGSKLGYADC